MSDPYKATEFKDIGSLLFRSSPAARIINFITLYRIVTFPLLLFFLLQGKIEIFKWLLLASFFTDAIDGFLARRYKVASVLGAKLDSIGDDLTVLAATVGLFVTRFAFIREQVTIFVVLFVLFLIQFGLSFYRHKKMSTFHTYLAKVAAVTTAIFLLSVFFFDRIYYGLFYAAVFLTGIGIIEEIILAVILKEYRSNVKGLYWVLKEAGQGRDGA